MDIDRVIEVLRITLPVFAMIGLGKILSIRGFINEDRKIFINEFVYTFSLPSLVFVNVAKQKFDNMWNPELIVSSIIALLITAFLYMILAKIFKYKGKFAAVLIFGIFWANSVYMGFPMCEYAFGGIGLDLAAVFNAYFMLIYIPAAFVLIGLYGGVDDGVSPLKRVYKIIMNPILLAAIAGTIVAYIGEFYRAEKILDNGAVISSMELPKIGVGILQILESFFRLVGSMGLPLALIAIGAAMSLKSITSRIFPLVLVLIGKLIILPAFTLICIWWLYPNANKEVIGVAVLMASLPNAVASYVIAKQAGVEEGFVSSILVLSTGVSIITIPLWLYIII